MAMHLNVFLLCTLLATLAFAQECTDKDYTAVYSECDKIANKRMVVYYWTRNCTGGVPLPAPIMNLPCDITCFAGEYLPIGKTACKACDPGTFSIGGGDTYQHFDKYHPTWPRGFKTFCAGEGCVPWTMSPSDPNINSGNNTGRASVISTLMLDVMLLRDGYVSFIYRVDSEATFDYLDFWIDDENRMFKQSGIQQWSLAWFHLPMGDHQLKWRYVKDFSVDFGLDMAFIEQIDISGTEYAEPSCDICPPGKFSPEHAHMCEVCPRDTYSTGGNSTCAPCPDGQWAPPDSGKCYVKPACTANDIETVLSTPNVDFKCMQKEVYTEPILCNQNDPDSVKPNPTPVLVDCPACPAGTLFDKAKLACTACAAGQSSLGGTCQECGGGLAAVREVNYPFNIGSEARALPTEFNTTCYGDCGNSGWRAHKGYLDSGAEHGGKVTSVLQWTGEVVSNVKGLTASGNPNDLHVVSMDVAVDCEDIGVLHCGLRVTANGVSVLPFYGSKFDFKPVSFVLPPGVIRAGMQQENGDKSTINLVFTFMSDDPTVNVAVTNARIRNLRITGTTALGGASKCSTCFAGTSSHAGASTCTECPAGSSSVDQSSECKKCEGNTYTRHTGSPYCVPCGPGTNANPTNTDCDIHGCTWSVPGHVNLTYDLSALARTDDMWGPIEDELHMTYYFNPCSLKHLNNSCHDEHGNAIETYACQITNHGYGVDLGNTLGYLPLSTNPAGGLIMTFTDGTPACDPKHSRETNITFICDPTVDKGFPAPPNAPIETPPFSCYYDAVWKSLYACPLCNTDMYHLVTGRCIDGKRTMMYRWDTRPKQCHDGVKLPDSYTEDCSDSGIPCPPGQYRNGTICSDSPAGHYSPGGGVRYDGFGMYESSFPIDFITECDKFIETVECSKWIVRDGVLTSGFHSRSSSLKTMVHLVDAGSLTFSYQLFGSGATTAVNAKTPGFYLTIDSKQIMHENQMMPALVTKTVALTKGLHEIVWEYVNGDVATNPMIISDITIMGTTKATVDPIPCPPGSYAGKAASKCTLCPVDTMSNVAGSSACTPCDDYEYAFAGERLCRKRPECTHTDIIYVRSECKKDPAFGLYQTEEAHIVRPQICHLNPNMYIPPPRNITCVSPPAGMYRDDAGVAKMCAAGFARQTTEKECTGCRVGYAGIQSLVFKDFSGLTSSFPSHGTWTTGCGGVHANTLPGWSTAPGTAGADQPLYSGYYPGEEMYCWASLTFKKLPGYYDPVDIEIKYKIDADAGMDEHMMYGFDAYVDSASQFAIRESTNGNYVVRTVRVADLSETFNHQLSLAFFQTHIMDDEECELGAKVFIESVTLKGVVGGAQHCYPCDAGLQSSKAHAVVCEQCNAGEFSPDVADTEPTYCTACPANRFSPTKRSSTCLRCGNATENAQGKNTDCNFAHCSSHLENPDIAYNLAPLMQAEDYAIPIDADKTAYLSLCSRTHSKNRCVDPVTGQQMNTFMCIENTQTKTVTNVGQVISFDPRVAGSSSFHISFSDGTEKATSYRTTIKFVCSMSCGLPGSLKFVSHDETKQILALEWCTSQACAPCKSADIVTTKGDCVNGNRTVVETAKPGVVCAHNLHYSEVCTKDSAGVPVWIFVSLSGVLVAAGAGAFCLLHKKNKHLTSKYAQLVSRSSGRQGVEFAGTAKLIDESADEEAPTTVTGAAATLAPSGSYEPASVE